MKYLDSGSKTVKVMDSYSKTGTNSETLNLKGKGSVIETDFY